MGGPVEPATVAKVKAPLNGRVCGRACLGSYDPALIPETPIGLMKKDSTKKCIRSQMVTQCGLIFSTQ